MRALPEIAAAIGLAVRHSKVEVTAALALLSNLRPVFRPFHYEKVKPARIGL